MPRLANDRQEQFARHRARGMNASKAALAAGYAPGSSTKHLDDDPDIVARIGELMDEFKAQREQQRAAAVAAAKVVGQMTGVGRAWVIEKLAQNALNAAQDGEYKESNRALELIGQEFGMFEGKESGDDRGGSNVPQTLNMDVLESVLDRAEADNTRPPSIEDQYGEDTALALIQGQTKKRESSAVPAGERKLTTGSETDVAIGNPDAIQWKQIDPNTPVDDVIDMVMGKMEVPDWDPEDKT